MIEEINPYHFYNQYEPRQPQPSDRILMFREEQVAMIRRPEGLDYPRFAELSLTQAEAAALIFLFRINEEAYFLNETSVDLSFLCWFPIAQFRELKPNYLAMAGITAVQLKRWRQTLALLRHLRSGFVRQSAGTGPRLSAVRPGRISADFALCHYRGDRSQPEQTACRSGTFDGPAYGAGGRLC